MARVVALVLLAVVAALALWSDRPPAPVPATAPATEFSAERALPIVADLARGPHPVGSPAAARVHDDVVARLRAQGLSPRVETAVVDGVAVSDVVATLPGTGPTGTVVLAAHTDSVPAGPGAADDVSSVAAILETVRALRAGPPLRDDVEVLLTDGEEAGLLGARAWVRDDLPPGRPTVVLNHEARGVAGPSLIFQTSPGNAGLVRVIADAVPHPRGDSSLVAVYRLLPNDTDLSAVLAAGRPGINSAFIERPSEYHTAGDTPAALSAASVQNQGSTMLALTRALGDADLRPLDPVASGLPPQSDAVWFRFLGAMVTYPQAWSLPIAVLAALLLVGAIVLGRRRGVLRVRGAVVAALTALVALVVALGLGAALGAVVGSGAGPYSRSLMTYEVVDVVLALLVVLAWALPLRRRCGSFATGAGAATVPVALGVVAAVLVPGASFLLALPGLGLALGLLAAVLLQARPTAAVAALTAGSVPTAVLLVPFAPQVFLVDGVAHGLATTAFVLAGLPITAFAVGGRSRRQAFKP